MKLTRGGWSECEHHGRPVIVNVGNAVRPSQLIRSVRRTGAGPGVGIRALEGCR